MTRKELKEYLDFKSEEFNNTAFIEDDPISIPHLFTKKEDIESIGFIMATISWGQRKSIIRNGHRLVEIMGHSPFEFIMNASENDLKSLKFVHRTFNAEDLRFFILGLRSIYDRTTNGLEDAFNRGESMAERIFGFREWMLEVPHDKRSEKHISNPLSGSASKRINMYLRWMVRDDNKGVDFGIWKSIPTADLYIPLDVHTGNVARKLGLIKRKANDWKALEELMTNVRKFDPLDPCKYDYALFGLGVTGEI
ncbi:MAG: TIGR02757 family protein [Crocinitomix sp.]|nr:TIGR02757 family protein [Crocinitomix sp.]